MQVPVVSNPRLKHGGPLFLFTQSEENVFITGTSVRRFVEVRNVHTVHVKKRTTNRN